MPEKGKLDDLMPAILAEFQKGKNGDCMNLTIIDGQGGNLGASIIKSVKSFSKFGSSEIWK